MTHIFAKVKDEKSLGRLRTFVMKDEILRNKILSIRKRMNNKRMTPENTMASNPEVLMLFEDMLQSGEIIDTQENIKIIRQLLKRLKIRSSSGVAVVSILTKPYTCPGRCIYCPTEKNMPKSYLSREPAAARALANRFDPYKQIWSRLKALVMNGHPIDKIEMILIGGTFNFYKKDYQEYFVKEVFRACNNWLAKENNRTVIEQDHNLTLTQLQEINETADARVIGLSIETRPDYITYQELKWLRYLGVTKVELGVQHLENDVLALNRREMTVESIREGVERLRDYGFKFVYHMMPNLPGSNPEKDIKMFKDLYNDKYHHPDMMKIYPNMILKGSLLYKWVTQGKMEYSSYNDETLTQVLADCEKEVMPYTRLIRIIRDIPADYIMIGSKKSNLRQDVDAFQKSRGIIQRDIRAREIRDMEIDPQDFELTEIWYETVRGYECFLQFENKKENKIAAFLRLRLPKTQIQIDQDMNRGLTSDTDTAHNWGLDKWSIESEEFYNNITKNTEAGNIDQSFIINRDTAFVRELHVYGTMKSVGEEGTQSQHTGMGKRLLQRAEEISRGDNSYNLHFAKIAIISGVGVRQYYIKRGYHLEATYMTKNLL